MVPSRLGRSAQLGVAVIAALFVVTVAGVAAAQISGASNSTSGASCSGGGSTDGDCRNSVSFTVNNGVTLTSRYAWNINADTGAFSTHDTSGNASHHVNFNATAVGGYRLDIATSRIGDLNRVNDLVGCDGNADTSGVTGTTSFPLNSGTLNLADPGAIPVGTDTASVPISQSSFAQLFRVSNGAAQAHALTFTWNGSVRSNSCEAAVRQGESSGTTTGCSACGYPGSPSRTQSSDGHFVTVTFTSLCGNGVVDGPAGEQCDEGAGNGTSGSCCTSQCQFKAPATTCRPAAGDCDLAETCSGMSGACPFDFKKPNGSGCRAANGQCDVPEFCDGVSNNCPADGFASNMVVCRAGSAGEVCDQTENCTGTGPNCPPDLVLPNTVICRASAGACDVAEHCDGTNKFCPFNSFAAATVVCRPGAGVCDVAENCTGSGPNCPADAFAANTVLCRASAGFCDVADNCPGTGPNCSADAKSNVICRLAQGVCDNAEACDGVNNDCPADGANYKSNTVVCRAAAGVCDVADNCTGSGPNCPANAFQPNTVQCRAAAGVCDAAENCSGSGAACPADVFQPNTVECRASAGVCDMAENCTGSGINCPADAKSTAQCRASAGVCDLADNCDGVNDDCPADAKSTAVCRAAANACDVADTCDGSNDTCPADAKQISGTPCSDGLFCNGAETCDGAGVCLDNADPCPVICDEANDQCLFSGCPVAPEPGCLTAQKSLLSIKNKTDNTKDKLIWKWIKGQSASQVDFADPTMGANYALCIYAGTTNSLVAELAVPPSPTLWSPLSTKGYKYFDASSGQDGVQKIKLKGSSSNKSKALVKGRGANLPDPIDMSTLNLPVKAQLINHGTAKCFEANYNSTIKNTTSFFKAKAP
jgi:hypothetical protein